MHQIVPRLLTTDPHDLSTHELLTALIAYGSSKKIDHNRQAKKIIDRFGTLGNVLTECPNMLRKSYNLDEQCVALLKLSYAVARSLAKEEINSRDVISSTDALIDYCKVSLSHLTIEHAVVLFLDRRNRVILESISKGTVDHSPVYPREIAKKALQLDASSIILVHNHPSGNPHPSLSDIQVTDKIVKFCESLEIRVLDHIIIGRSRYISFRQAGLINDKGEN